MSGNMDVTVVYSTDGLNKRFGLVTLEDDLHFFPEYNGVYLLRADLYEDFKRRIITIFWLPETVKRRMSRIL